MMEEALHELKKSTSEEFLRNSNGVIRRSVNGAMSTDTDRNKDTNNTSCEYNSKES